MLNNSCKLFLKNNIKIAHPFQDIKLKLSALKDRIKTDHPSIVLVFMSHGVREGILGVDRTVVTIEDIKDIFSGRNCPALIGKPKIMFFQACRGGNVKIVLLSYTDNLAGLLIWI